MMTHDMLHFYEDNIGACLMAVDRLNVVALYQEDPHLINHLADAIEIINRVKVRNRDMMLRQKECDRARRKT